MQTRTTNAEELENIEIDRYINMIQEKGYGYTLEDQRKRVKAGVIIARHIYKKQINNYDNLLNALKEVIANYENL